MLNAEDVEIKDYLYGFFVTSLELPAHLVWTNYWMRADAQNMFKELKDDFGADNFNIQIFCVTEPLKGQGTAS